MSQTSLTEYIPRVRNRYARMTGKQARSVLLDEFCAVSGWERKYAMKVLQGKRRGGGGPRSRWCAQALWDGSGGGFDPLLAGDGAALRQADGGDAAVVGEASGGAERGGAREGAGSQCGHDRSAAGGGKDRGEKEAAGAAERCGRQSAGGDPSGALEDTGGGLLRRWIRWRTAVETWAGASSGL